MYFVGAMLGAALGAGEGAEDGRDDGAGEGACVGLTGAWDGLTGARDGLTGAWDGLGGAWDGLGVAMSNVTALLARLAPGSLPWLKARLSGCAPIGAGSIATGGTGIFARALSDLDLPGPSDSCVTGSVGIGACGLGTGLLLFGIRADGGGGPGGGPPELLDAITGSAA